MEIRYWFSRHRDRRLIAALGAARQIVEKPVKGGIAAVRPILVGRRGRRHRQKPDDERGNAEDEQLGELVQHDIPPALAS